MKQKQNEDYNQPSFHIVPDWVKDFVEDRLSGELVISSLEGGWIMADEDDTTDLEEYR